jgi:Ala-tRNA(Pro) deacylase
MNIAFEMKEHPAAHTIEEMESMGICDDVVKNLFLRDAKGARHFLVVLSKEKQGDMKKISEQLGCSRLSFASEERLLRCLKLTRGSVSPLGVLNDSDASVEVVFDKTLRGRKRVGVHPNDNTATVWLSFDDLHGIVRGNGNSIRFIDL